MRILVLPADGIGPEIVGASMSVLQSANETYQLDLTFDYDDVGLASLNKFGTTLWDSLLDEAKNYDGSILGPRSHMDYPPVEQPGRNISLGFPIGLDFYANVKESCDEARL